MKKVLLSVVLAAGMLGAADFSIGVNIGPPPPPRVVRVRPVAPSAGYTWVDGYWYADGRHWRWHDGYWTRPPYEGARWAAPRYEGGQFYNGYWQSDRGNFGHEHAWDRDRSRRDYNRGNQSEERRENDSRAYNNNNRGNNNRGNDNRANDNYRNGDHR